MSANADTPMLFWWNISEVGRFGPPGPSEANFRFASPLPMPFGDASYTGG